MTDEGIFPKVPGDVVHASDLNNTYSSIMTNTLLDFLSLSRNNIYSVSLSALAGSTNMEYHNSNLTTTLSGNSHFNNTIDDFNDNALGSFWGSVTGGTTPEITETGTFIKIGGAIPNSVGAKSYIAQVTWSGTNLENMFDYYGGYFRVALGSVYSDTNASSQIHTAVIFNDVILTDTYGTTFTTSGPWYYDFRRIGSSDIYYRFMTGTAWGGWTGPVSAGGSPYISFLSSGANEGNSAASGGMYVDWIKSVSGTIATEFIGSRNLQTTTNVYGRTFGPAVVTLSGVGYYNNLGSITHNYSLNGGTNYTNGSINQLVNIGTPGSVFTLKWQKTENYGSGVYSGFRVSHAGVYFL